MKRIFLVTSCVLLGTALLQACHTQSQDYIIRCKGTNVVIDVLDWSLKDSTDLILYWGFKANANQRWIIEPEGNYVRLFSVLNGKAMTLMPDSIPGRFKVVQCEKGLCDDSNKQLWEMKKIGNDYRIRSKYNNYTLATEDNRNLLLLPEVNKEAALWKLVSPGNNTLSREEVGEDIDFYIKTLEENHVNPYFKAPKDTILKAMKAIVDRAPMTEEMFGTLLLQTNHFFDGHTHIIFNNQGKIDHYLNEGGMYFPPVTLGGGSTVFLPDGTHGMTRITSINGIPVRSILQVMGNMRGLENSDAKICRIQMSFSPWLIEWCDITSPFRVTGENASGKVEYSVTGLTKEDYDKIKPVWVSQSRENQALRSFFYDADSIAVLQYNSCASNQLGDMDVYLTDFFRKVREKNIRYLFIDVTSNGGGSTNNNNYIFKYLKHDELYNSARITMKLSKALSEYGKIGSDAVVDSLKNLCIVEYHDAIPVQPEGFSGKVFVLQSRFTYSAADYFSVFVKQNRLAVIAGEPTGQPLHGYIQSAGGFLPNSGIFFNYSIKYFEILGVDCPTESVCPDIPIEIGCEIPDEFPVELLKRIIVRSRE